MDGCMEVDGCRDGKRMEGCRGWTVVGGGRL